VCGQHGVPLPAVALQYPRRHGGVDAVLCGMRSIADVDQNLAWSKMLIPDALWRDLALPIATGALR
jgi:D-threo-aldose 1-dehydrogenase